MSRTNTKFACFKNQSLTAIESLGLKSPYDLANGHASHELTEVQESIINSLPFIWKHSMNQKSHDVEMEFKQAFVQLANAPSLAHYQYFKICPTASNSIDLIAAWLCENHIKTALIEPTFDNIHLILKRRNVAITVLSEERLFDGQFAQVLDAVDAVFLVNPNNPTGKTLTKALFADIVDWCSRNKKIIILDNSFRFFVPQAFGAYQLLLDAGVLFFSIEDTGKIWPTQEIKASLLLFSKCFHSDISIIYDEIFLCHSNVALSVLTRFMQDAFAQGLDQSVWKEVSKRRLQLRHALDHDILSIDEASIHSTLGVEWVKIGRYFKDDVACAKHFYERQLIVLPGSHFYWSRQGKRNHARHVRFALMKQSNHFSNAIRFLKNELIRLSS